MWPFLSRCVDEIVLSVRAVGAHVPALHRADYERPTSFDVAVAEQEENPPEVRIPAQLERRPGRIGIRLPVVGYDTFADFHPARRADADTLVVYHHGLGEIPHDASARPILGRGRLAERCDWLAIRGAHHESFAAVDQKLLSSPESFGRGLASSVFAARRIATALRPRYRHLVYAGMSMGGVIGLIEQCLGSLFDLCIPLMSGPDLESVVLRSSFSRVVCRQYRRRAVERGLAREFELTARLARPGPPIRPVLGAHDRLFRFDAQRAAYARVPRAVVRVIDGGHITGAIQVGVLSAHVEEMIDRELWAPAAAALAAPAPRLAAVA